jgi:hypothetical protein
VAARRGRDHGGHHRRDGRRGTRGAGAARSPPGQQAGVRRELAESQLLTVQWLQRAQSDLLEGAAAAALLGLTDPAGGRLQGLHVPLDQVGRVTIAGAAWGLREELAGLGEECGPLLGFLLDRAELGLDRFTEERRQRQPSVSAAWSTRSWRPGSKRACR